MTAFTNLFKDSPERLIFDVYGNSVAFLQKPFFVPHGNYVENNGFRREKE